ncbi:MAG TPA: CU044_2847 family protein [Actinocrinis sp.]|jgi:hypothetical protein
MPTAVEFALADGTTVVVAPSARMGSGTVGMGERLQAAEKTLRQALEPVTAAAAEMMDDFRRLAHPDEVEIGFGVSLDGKLGGIIVNVNADAHLDVTLRWRADAARAEPSAAQSAQSVPGPGHMPQAEAAAPPAG